MTSGKDRKCPAIIALSSDDIGGKPKAARRKSIRCLEVNCWRFAWARWSLGEVNMGLFMSVACILVVAHLKAFRTDLLSLHNIHFFISHTARQLSSHNFPKDSSAGPELTCKSGKSC